MPIPRSQPPHSLTRRGFLLRCALAAAVPALGRCGSSSAPAPVAPAAIPLPPRLRRILPFTEPQLRVRVARARTADGPVLIGRQQWIALRTGAGDGAGTGTEMVLRGPLRINLGSERWDIVDADGAAAPLDGFPALDLESRSDDAA